MHEQFHRGWGTFQPSLIGQLKNHLKKQGTKVYIRQSRCCYAKILESYYYLELF